ncbi:MAG: PDZ domain-containing protein [Planctomycetaceae bacterium]
MAKWPGAILTVSLLLCCTGTAGAGESASADGKIRALVADLDDAAFAVRLAASRQLQSVNTEDIAKIAELADSHPSAEVAARLLEILELRYLSEDPDAVHAASEALESLCASDRLLVAEGAKDCLDRNWKTRVNLAAAELESLGSLIQRETARRPAPFGGVRFGGMLPQFQNDELKVFLTEDYTGGSEGLRQFRRMTSLIRPQGMQLGLGVFVIDGHTLAEADIQQLQNELGVGRVVARGRVALGITGRPSPVPAFPGCLLMEVVRNGSAAAAGLHEGDLITGLGDTPLKDFEDLVERLKAFDVGDTVEVTVIRNFTEHMDQWLFRQSRRGDLENMVPEKVSVNLKGWREFINPPVEEPGTPALPDDAEPPGNAEPRNKKVPVE